MLSVDRRHHEQSWHNSFFLVERCEAAAGHCTGSCSRPLAACDSSDRGIHYREPRAPTVMEVTRVAPRKVARLFAVAFLSCAVGLCRAQQQQQQQQQSAYNDFSSKVLITLADVHPCSKLLNRTVAIGCETTTPEVHGYLRMFDTIDELKLYVAGPDRQGASSEVLVLPFSVFAAANYFATVSAVTPAGILVLSPSATDVPAQFSPDVQNPQQGLGLYPEEFYNWNPLGNSLSHEFVRYPIFLLGNDSSPLLVSKCQENKNRSYSFPRWSVEMVLTMQAQTDTATCLAAGVYMTTPL